MILRVGAADGVIVNVAEALGRELVGAGVSAKVADSGTGVRLAAGDG